MLLISRANFYYPYVLYSNSQNLTYNNVSINIILNAGPIILRFWDQRVALKGIASTNPQKLHPQYKFTFLRLLGNYVVIMM